MDEVLQKTSYKTEESLFAAIGFGEIGAITVFNRLTEKERREEERAKAKAEAEELVKGGEVKVENKDTLKVKHEGGVVIEGASGLLVRIANVVILFQVMISLVIYQRSWCCHPSCGLYEPSFTGKLRATSSRMLSGKTNSQARNIWLISTSMDSTVLVF